MVAVNGHIGARRELNGRVPNQRPVAEQPDITFGPTPGKHTLPRGNERFFAVDVKAVSMRRRIRLHTLPNFSRLDAVSGEDRRLLGALWGHKFRSSTGKCSV